MEQQVLAVNHLSVSFFTHQGEVRAVQDVSLGVRSGQIVGLVGESGCGKSVTARAIMGLLKAPGRIVAGQVLLCGQDLVPLPERKKAALRGNALSMVFQEPMTSLNPVMRVGSQVAEALRIHTALSGEAARREAVRALEAVGIPDPENAARRFPHQLSGGLRQRVMIAMAMVCKPKLLVADEPTTALDVTVEAQILRLMRQLCAQGTGILLISHNLGVIAQVCDRVHVMYAGRVVEEADTDVLFDRPLHPYTRGLLRAVFSLRSGSAQLDTIPGTVPALTDLPAGCAFAPRCEMCSAACTADPPPWVETETGHFSRCGRANGEVLA